MKIIYEDNCIIVCVKPEGLLSQGDVKGTENAVSLLREITGSDIFPVHRLDRTTFGLMVFAKNSAAACALSRDIAEHRFKKRYIALAHGSPETQEGRLEDLLFFDRTKNKAFIAKKQRAGVKKAVLDYKVTETLFLDNSEVSLLDIELHTGRTHQIRVQLASRNMPLLGDRRYGAQDDFKRIALCSAKLGFEHPVTKKYMDFDICDTDDLLAWRKYFLRGKH